VARVLRPGGLFIVTATDDRHCDLTRALAPDELRARAGVAFSESAYCLRDLGPEAVEPLRERLCGVTVRLDGDGRCLFVTPPFGNFEFFAPHARTAALIEARGLTRAAATCSVGLDAHGFECRRWHCLYQR
jgi:hypothetical protein